jgi:hypothetical protein
MDQKQRVVYSFGQCQGMMQKNSNPCVNLMICKRSDLPEMVKYMLVSHISKCTERRGVALVVASGSQINAERIDSTESNLGIRGAHR